MEKNKWRYACRLLGTSSLEEGAIWHDLKAGIVEPEETDVSRQRLGKHVPAGPNIPSDECVRHVAC
jgi:hypothetical protein